VPPIWGAEVEAGAKRAAATSPVGAEVELAAP
jgi:hypothetical protein